MYLFSYDYWQVLMLERPSRGSFPGGYVFPGGMAEKSDESSRWLRLFESAGIDVTKLNSISSGAVPSGDAQSTEPNDAGLLKK